MVAALASMYGVRGSGKCYIVFRRQSKSGMCGVYLLLDPTTEPGPKNISLSLLHVHKRRQQFIEVLICLAMDRFTPFFIVPQYGDKDTRRRCSLWRAVDRRNVCTCRTTIFFPTSFGVPSYFKRYLSK